MQRSVCEALSQMHLRSLSLNVEVSSAWFLLWGDFWGPTTACCLGVLLGNMSFTEQTPSRQLNHNKS